MAARSGILGLGSRLYPGNMQRIFNKDLTRFMQSLSRESKRKALLAGWEKLACQIFLDKENLSTIPHLHEQFFLVKENLSRKNCSCKWGLNAAIPLRPPYLHCSEPEKLLFPLLRPFYVNYASIFWSILVESSEKFIIIFFTEKMKMKIFKEKMNT